MVQVWLWVCCQVNLKQGTLLPEFGSWGDCYKSGKRPLKSLVSAFMLFGITGLGFGGFWGFLGSGFVLGFFWDAISYLKRQPACW